MKNKFTLLLLPGLDGTGDLFNPALPSTQHLFETRVVRYPSHQKLDIVELANLVVQETSIDEDLVLVAESFSGPVAQQVAASGRRRVRAIVFCASFVDSPRPTLLAALHFLPLTLLLSLHPPTWIIKTFCLGSNASVELVKLFRDTIRKVPPEILAYRLRCLSTLSQQQNVCSIPCAYLRASGDCLVPRSCFERVRNCFPQVELIEVSGPHLLLQANPNEAMQAINEFIARI